MATFTLLVLAAVCITQSFGQLTAAQHKQARDALYNTGKKLHHGDMKLSKRQKAGLKNRVAMNDLTARWPKGVIPYEVADSLSQIKGMIQEAADQIRDRTDGCINFVERTNEDVYLQMHHGDGCWSYVGILQPGQPQELSLGDGCHFVGTIVHEMLHAVGFEHAQNRPDRDQYLEIYVENMLGGRETADTQFELVKDGRTFDTGFDWDSIMLYGNYAFSKQPGVLKTMEDRNGEHELHDPYEKSAPHLTDGDVHEIKKLYQCPVY